MWHTLSSANLILILRFLFGAVFLGASDFGIALRSPF